MPIPESRRKTGKICLRLPHHTLDMLAQLVEDGYAESRTQVVVDAVAEAHTRECVRPPRRKR